MKRYTVLCLLVSISILGPLHYVTHPPNEPSKFGVEQSMTVFIPEEPPPLLRNVSLPLSNAVVPDGRCDDLVVNVSTEAVLQTALAAYKSISSLRDAGIVRLPCIF